MNTIKKITVIISVMLFIAGCSDPLEKENLKAITSSDVWGSSEIAEAYVNDIYASLMPAYNPGWGYPSASMQTGGHTDEAIGSYMRTLLSDYLKGTITIDSYNYFPYDIIRRINIFLAGIDAATFADAQKKQLKGEALFWRAWAYFKMVYAYGGVPLVLTPTPVGDNDAIFTPRNKTSECFTQILKDMDDAINLLKDKDNIGRIDKCAAIAFKGRVLLFKASPQFNRTNTVSLWADAYNANKQAITFLNSQGKGLYDSYKGIWLNKMNKEVIMVRRHSYPESPNGGSSNLGERQRPEIYSPGGNGLNYPSLELVNADPLKNGSMWDPKTMDYRKLHQNRSKRFYDQIAFNGASPYIPDMVINQENLWTYYYDKDGNPNTGVNGKESSPTSLTGYSTFSSFYCAKMNDQNITKATCANSAIDYIEIRYAEVLLNLAEAANEAGNNSDALDALYKIRNRAGIDAGVDGKYGITATTVASLRQVIQNERFVELAFEDKRWWDLRRWRTYTKVFSDMANGTRHGLMVQYNGPVSARPVGMANIDTFFDKLTIIVQEDNAGKTAMLAEDKYSFFGIPAAILARNSKMEQNNTWGGTFDPLQ